MPIPIANILHMAGASVANKLTGRKAPLNLMLALTDRCTGNCSYCQLPARKSPEMTTAEILKLLDEAAAAGCQRVGLWGGEPLLREDLGPIIRHARKQGLFVTVDTNGHLVPKSIEILQDANHLNISLDGNQDAHDANRGTGAFAATMKGLEAAAREGFAFWTITVLTKHNLDQIDWLLELARKMNFLTTFQVLHHNESIGCNQGLYPTQDELRQTALLLAERKRSGAPIASSLGYLERLATWPDYRINRYYRLDNYPSCLAGRLYCNVDVDGSMYPCSLFVDEVESPPNVRDLGFAGAFEAMQIPACNACLAGCFTEYNLLYSLDLSTGINWVRALIK